MPRIAAVLLMVVLFVAGCGGDDDESSGTSTTESTGASGATGPAEPSEAEEPDQEPTEEADVDVDAIVSCLDDAGLSPSDPEDAELDGESAQSISITAGDIPDNGNVYVFESEKSAAKAEGATQLSINVYEETVGAVTAVLITGPAGAEGDEAKEAIGDCIAG